MKTYAVVCVLLLLLTGCTGRIQINKSPRLIPVAVASSIIGFGVAGIVAGSVAANYNGRSVNGLIGCRYGDLIGPCAYDLNSVVLAGYITGFTLASAGIGLILLEYMKF